MARLRDALDQRRARLVVGERPRVGHGEHRDPQRHEGTRLVDPGHGKLTIRICGRPPPYSSPFQGEERAWGTRGASSDAMRVRLAPPSPCKGEGWGGGHAWAEISSARVRAAPPQTCCSSTPYRSSGRWGTSAPAAARSRG